MLLSTARKSNSEIASLIVQEEPFDPLTMFQRWLLRTRVAGAEPLGLDLGDSKDHAEALQQKLTGLVNISSELGQYYCWNGQHEEAIKCLDQCQKVHQQHSTLQAEELRCHLNVIRIEALSKLARLAVGTPLEKPKDNLLNRVKALETNEQHDVLADEFFKDNKARSLPYAWRQCALRSVLKRGDMENGTFLAIANALYQLGEPSQMMLAIPTQVIHFLRAIVFEGGHEADAYLCSSIFEDIMKAIAEAEAAQMSDINKRKIKGFVSKFCATVGHVLCYEAAWTLGLLVPSPSDWGKIWQVREVPLQITNSTTDGMSEDEILARIFELMDPDDIERYLLSSAARFLEKHEAKYLVMFKQIEYKLQELTAMSKLGILAMEHEERREARTIARLEHKINASLQAQASVRVEKVENAMEVDGETQTAAQDAIGLTDEEQAREQEKTREICDLLKQFLESYGVLEQDLQLRCLAICINGKQWEFLSGYCRAAVAVVDRNAHPEICQVYNILVPLAEIMSISQNLGVDFKDITSAHCLDALVSTNMADILNVLRLASWDLIHGLLPIATRPPPSPQPSAPGGGGYRWRQGSAQHDTHNQPGARMEDDTTTSEGQDHGHAAILKLFGMVRLRGIVDVFGALVAGALTSILSPKEKLTLSEFGYHALFTTTLESTSSWTDDRIKSIVALSNGDSARAIRGIPGAVVRFIRLLTQLYERQIQFETNTLTTKLRIETEARAKAAPIASADQLRSSGSNATPLFSTKATASLVRYSLCLTDIYYLEGKHQDALASFLNACMMCSKGFADAERLKRRVWGAYNNGFSLSSAVTPATQTIVPSQGGPLPGPDIMGVQSFQSLTSLSNMGGAHPASGHAPTAVGLGLSSPSPAEGNSSFNMPGTIPQTPTVPSQQLMPGPIPPYNTPGSQPSTFALRAIECCIQLNELLAGVLMYQFLPRIDYAQVYAVIRSAYEKGLLVASGAPPTLSSKVTPMPPHSMNPGPTMTPPMLHPGSHVPGVNPSYQQSPNGTPLVGSVGVSGPSATLAASPRVYTSVSVFTPEFKKSSEDKQGRRGSLLPPISRRDAMGVGPTFALQQFLDLMFDLPMLERICHHFKASKDEEGMLKVRTRINNNRLALDLRQPFRDQVQALAQQDLLSRLWSRYARMG
ncbi:hypothetical protein BGZ68_010493 [Mortierella alpina]|nr:hypothetical protein BGZ68_010493 [Mortierella alpina]